MIFTNVVLAVFAICSAPLVFAQNLTHVTTGASLVTTSTSFHLASSRSISTSSNPLASLILAGLGSTPTTSVSESVSTSTKTALTASVSSTDSHSTSTASQSSTQIDSTSTSFVTEFETKTVLSTRKTKSSSALVSNHNVSQGLQCQSALVSWSEEHVFYYNYTTIATASTTAEAFFGIADVYTTVDGVPRAHGTLTVTSSHHYVGTYYRTHTYNNEPSTTGRLLLPSPNCTIAQTVCNSMYSSYSSSLHLGTDKTIPYIFPVPTNSPRCNEGNVYDGCTGTITNAGCTIFGANVQVFYWPTATTTNSDSIATRTPNGSSIVTAVVRNITMTSPSVYLSFQKLSALATTYGGNECGSVVDGDQALAPVGSSYTSKLFSMAPQSLSSIIKDMGVDSASIVSVIALGPQSEYERWIPSLLFASQIQVRMLR